MQILKTEIEDVLVLCPKVFSDSRGFFLESYNRRTLAAKGFTHEFVQDNHSRSKQDVLRGLHYQIQQPQGKLVRVVAGEIFDVALDIRRNSSTFGRWVGRTLSSENMEMLWVPPGFAHGFVAMSEWAEVLYKATEYYAPHFERTILWNDPELQIPWPVNNKPLLSEKDTAGKLLRDAEL